MAANLPPTPIKFPTPALWLLASSTGLLCRTAPPAAASAAPTTSRSVPAAALSARFFSRQRLAQLPAQLLELRSAPGQVGLRVEVLDRHEPTPVLDRAAHRAPRDRPGFLAGRHDESAGARDRRRYNSLRAVGERDRLEYTESQLEQFRVEASKRRRHSRVAFAILFPIFL